MSCLLALCLQLGIGVTHANPQDCGIWYLCEPNAPYVQHLNAFDWYAGVETETFRVGYERLGQNGTDATIPGYGKLHDAGEVEGVYAERRFEFGMAFLEGGLWVYRSGYAVNPGWEPRSDWYSSSRLAPGAIAGAGLRYGPAELRYSIRMAENRSTDPNENHLPSTIKAFTQTITIGVSF